ncbi:hypothetical protein MMC22_001480 [Lobaria immixta]|nr:hypothetical protein [Lobaria immixta]
MANDILPESKVLALHRPDQNSHCTVSALAFVRCTGRLEVLSDGKLISDINIPFEWPYSAGAYASLHVRVAGDAGCFIGPFFSSGVHLALLGGLSAATTICVVRRGDCNEATAAKWHSNKVGEGYTRFLLVVLSALKQIREADEAILSDFDDEEIDRAFALFRPSRSTYPAPSLLKSTITSFAVIQGTSDVNAKLSQEEISKTIDFCCKAFRPAEQEKEKSALKKLEAVGFEQDDSAGNADKPRQMVEMLEATLTEDETRIVNTIRACQMIRAEDAMHIENLVADIVDGRRINLEHGSLGFAKATRPVKKKQRIAAMPRFVGED